MKPAKSMAAVAVVMACLMSASCAHFGGKKEKVAVEAVAAQAAPAKMTEADYENALRQEVQSHIKQVNASKDSDQNQVIRRRPYFMREYNVYTSEDDIKIVLQQKESKSNPYVADVTLAKQRFATRLHRKRAEAAADTNFLRDTGTELTTYEWRNGHWMKSASMFVADASEENVNGEWLPLAETSKRTVQAEEPKSEGILKQIWYTLVGK